VLVTTRSIEDPDTGELRDSLSRDWSSFLDSLGVSPIAITNGLSDPSRLVDELAPDAVLLTNGEDVGSHPPRDRTENALVDAAVAADLPVVGVCRGHQFLNRYYGGEIDDLSALGIDEDHGGTEHEIVVEGPGEEVLPDSFRVNSYHDMGLTVDTVAADLEVFARSGDVVEGLYHPDRPHVSIQWHPERPLPDPDPVSRFVRKALNGGFQ
jgi:putative glutamine amidotransferase